MNKIDKLNLIQNAKELYSNQCFRRINESKRIPGRFLLLYYFKGDNTETAVFTIDLSNLNKVYITDRIQEDWSKKIKDKLINYFKLLGFDVR